ncbi:MAG: peptidase C45 [Acidobacteriaceae bacterium]|nr:peptidase C45 [Acidobacteriaceae bacterium]
MRKIPFRAVLAFAVLLSGAAAFAAAPESTVDSRLNGGFRNATQAGWIFVHLQGSPSAIGFQHGYLLTPEIEDAKAALELSVTHEVKHDWNDMRGVAEKFLWPQVPAEYRQELQGIADGLKAHGSKLDVMDVVVMNASLELPYYYDVVARQQGKPGDVKIGEHCSAFVATGSYTKDGRIVMGHNIWTDYVTGSRWNMVFDIVPASGHHLIMDGVPGLIHSGDDFGMNDAGILITETTISNFHGFDVKGIPEFVRARRAMQYAESIDDFSRIMQKGNNGGYANAWLVGDRKTNEIARLELGLKYVTLERTSDGYFVGSNFPVNPQLRAAETDYPNDPNFGDETRHRRWEQLMAENKGQIDVEMGKKFETDHYDVITKEIDPSERTLCGHIDRSSRGMKGWQAPYAPAGTTQAKVTDSALAEKMSFAAGMGHPCGTEFHAKAHLDAHKEFDWQRSELQDLKANPWIVVAAQSSPQSEISRGQQLP